MKEKLQLVYSYLFAGSILCVLLVTSIDFHCFRSTFYEEQYARYHTAQELGLTQEDLMRATTTLLDYLQDKRENIDVEIEIHELPAQVFNEKEAMHMIDVKQLYQNALFARMIAIGILVIGIVYAWMKKQSYIWYDYAKANLVLAKLFCLFLCFIGIWAIADFTSLWAMFHHVFFTNDLWLLNPNTDLMINLFPERFFFQLVTYITITFVIAYGLVLLLSAVYLKKHIPLFYRWKRRNKDE